MPTAATEVQVTEIQDTITILSMNADDQYFIPDHHRRLDREGFQVLVPRRPTEDGGMVILCGTVSDRNKKDIAEILDLSPRQFEMASGLIRLRRANQLAKFTSYED